MPDADRTAGLFPALLKHWRAKRGLSQLDLALAAGVSSRHISFLETGRSSASAEMVLRLAATLDVPLRQTNTMLRAAGHAPVYPEPTPGEALPPTVQAAIDLMKAHHEPFPAMVIDRTYRLLDTNVGASVLLEAIVAASGADSSADVNLARLVFEPKVGRAFLDNYDEVGRELLWRIQRDVLADPDHGPVRDLLDDIMSMDSIDPQWRYIDPTQPAAPSVEVRMTVGEARWSFTVLVTAVQAPLTVALDELRIEMWFPNDDATADGCRALVGGRLTGQDDS